MRLNSSTELLPAVLPIIDMHDGAVDFRVNGSWVRRWHPDVHRLDALLRRAVGRPRWDSSTDALVAHVAALGLRQGLRIEVPLLPFCHEGLAGSADEDRRLEPAQ